MNESVCNPCLTQNFRRLIEGVAFPDCPQVEHDFVTEESHFQIFLIKLDQVHSTICFGFSYVGMIRHLSIRAHESPATNQRGNGDIECSTSEVRKLSRFFQQAENLRRNARGALTGVSIDLRDLAAWI